MKKRRELLNEEQFRGNPERIKVFNLKLSIELKLFECRSRISVVRMRPLLPKKNYSAKVVVCCHTTYAASLIRPKN